MSKHVLFICQSCRFSRKEEEERNLPGGTHLLNQVLKLAEDWSHRSQLEIQAVECLWTCKHHCAVAFSAAQKSTYLFMNLTPTDGDALLQFGEQYLESSDGSIDWDDIPKALRAVGIGQIPSI
ncbi:DUF1636 domain-containing protein [Phormidium tenue FACHB-886]|nr:DUF1636 domain-containing protein [Phormidium tenue FACHB-886]